MDPLAHLLLPPAPRTWILWLLTLGLLLIGVLYGVKGSEQSEQADLIDAQIVALRARQQSAQPTSMAQQQVKDDAPHWAKLRSELQFPWPQVLISIEHAANTDIELLELQPDKANGALTLRGEAKTRQALANYLTLLNKQPSLTAVHMVHEVTVERDRLETVEFEIRAGIVR